VIRLEEILRFAQDDVAVEAAETAIPLISGSVKGCRAHGSAPRYSGGGNVVLSIVVRLVSLPIPPLRSLRPVLQQRRPVQDNLQFTTRRRDCETLARHPEGAQRPKDLFQKGRACCRDSSGRDPSLRSG
jgi:hypothetical protein